MWPIAERANATAKGMGAIWLGAYMKRLPGTVNQKDNNKNKNVLVMSSAEGTDLKGIHRTWLSVRHLGCRKEKKGSIFYLGGVSK